VAERIHNGDDVETACAAGREALTAAGFAPVEYLELRDAQSLAPGDITDPCRILAAAWLGDTRLIDNIPLV
jgi:pantoate--beta-alanine ligase